MKNLRSPLDEEENVQQTINECGSNSVVECNLAKVEVASSNLVSRSRTKPAYCSRFFFMGYHEDNRASKPVLMRMACKL